MSPTLLEVSDLRMYLGAGTARAVDGIDFSIRRGETFVLLGESGCGKSMTALSIMRLLPPSGTFVSGRIVLDGVDLLKLPETAMRDVRGRRIAMIFQEPQSSLNPVLTIGDQIGESLRRHRGLKGAAEKRRVLELLDAVGIPDPKQRHGEYPHQLSGGMKQRVMIAMALAAEPDLLIADEPTTALDVTIQAQVLELLRELKRRTDMAILLITHDLGVVAETADRVAVMYAGQLVEQSDRETFFRAPAHPYSQKLFQSLPGAEKRGGELAVIRGGVPPLTGRFAGCRFESRCDRRWEPCVSQPPRWLPLDDAHAVRCHLHDPLVRPAPAAAAPPPAAVAAPEVPAASGDTLLSVRDLQVHFPIQKGIFKRTVGYVYAVDGVSIDIPSGTTLALVGESGCGKTTAGKGIVRLIAPTGGSVRYRGADLARMDATALRRARADVQFIFQDPYSSMNPRMTVGDIVAEGMVAQRIGGDRTAHQRRVGELLALVGLDAGAARRYPHEFSGGQRQRICIARALAVNPKLVICDEPTSALDVSVQAQILNLLKTLQRRLGLSYLFITHNLSVVEYLAHRVAVMYLGRIVEHGAVDEVLRDPKHPYTRALLSAVPQIDPQSRREVIRLQGELPSPASPPPGCHFSPRCAQAQPRCREAYPGEVAVGGTHRVRCILFDG